LPSVFDTNRLTLSFLMFMVLIGLSVYAILLIGWASNSKYRIIGSVRACSQSIRYEIRISIIIFSIILVLRRFNLSTLVSYNISIVWVTFPILTIWIISCVAECNRAPLDFAEGESELVSGFNVEYGSGVFALIFVSEYGIIIFFSLVTGILFSSLRFLPFFFLILNFILLIRSSYPRIRYDKLISLAWVKILPVRLLIILILSLIL
jgi:NADH-ubiquinone oxidoreductase chain 1